MFEDVEAIEQLEELSSTLRKELPRFWNSLSKRANVSYPDKGTEFICYSEIILQIIRDCALSIYTEEDIPSEKIDKLMEDMEDLGDKILEIGKHFRRKTPTNQALLYNLDACEKTLSRLCTTPIEA